MVSGARELGSRDGFRLCAVILSESGTLHFRKCSHIGAWFYMIDNDQCVIYRQEVREIEFGVFTFGEWYRWEIPTHWRKDMPRPLSSWKVE